MMGTATETAPKEEKTQGKNIDDLDIWIMQRHFELRRNKFYGKVTISYENGTPCNRKIEVNEKPIKM